MWASVSWCVFLLERILLQILCNDDSAEDPKMIGGPQTLDSGLNANHMCVYLLCVCVWMQLWWNVCVWLMRGLNHYTVEVNLAIMCKHRHNIWIIVSTHETHIICKQHILPHIHTHIWLRPDLGMCFVCVLSAFYLCVLLESKKRARPILYLIIDLRSQAKTRFLLKWTVHLHHSDPVGRRNGGG